MAFAIKTGETMLKGMEYIHYFYYDSECMRFNASLEFATIFETKHKAQKVLQWFMHQNRMLHVYDDDKNMRVVQVERLE
ncbi:hypothetical protein ACRHK7_01200 [Weissella tructae]|uniref:hypothetical protein n=1 Tax=Weissella tructae TaxID=887702 RepID=UPI003D8DAFF8